MLNAFTRERAREASACSSDRWPGRDSEPARYLLLDEPTNNLDIAHLQWAIRTAAGTARQDNGVVAVLQGPGLAATHAERIVVLGAGRVDADGRPGVILTADATHEAGDVSAITHTHTVAGPCMLSVEPGPGQRTESNHGRCPCSSP